MPPYPGREGAFWLLASALPPERMSDVAASLNGVSLADEVPVLLGALTPATPPGAVKWNRRTLW